MRIAFFADNFYPEISGISDSILITGNELTKRGHEVIYVAPRYTPAAYEMVRQKPTVLEGHEVVHGMPVVRLPSAPLPYSPTGQSRIAFPTGASFSFFDRFPPDIVHTHSPYGAGIEALRVAKRYNAPLVGTNHTMIEEFYPFAPTLMRHFDAWYYNHASFVSTPYATLLTRMRQKGFRKEGHAIPNPFESALFRPPHAAEVTELKRALGFGGPVLLYAGRLAAEKKVDQVLRAVANLLPEFPLLTFVATGHGAAKAGLETLASRLGITAHVVFTGFIPMEELARYYQAADAFTLMSTSDSQSLSLMQAYASGLPAVCARSHGLPDYTPPSCGFLVEPGNIEELTARLRQLLHDSLLRERMGREAVAYVRQFSPEKIATQWEDIYRSRRSPESTGSFSAGDSANSSEASSSSRKSRLRMKRVSVK